MRNPAVDDVIRLKRDIPNLNLHKGDTGIVRSLMCAPNSAYEVEFSLGLDARTRAVLMKDQLEIAAADFESPVPFSEEAFNLNTAGVW